MHHLLTCVLAAGLLALSAAPASGQSNGVSDVLKLTGAKRAGQLTVSLKVREGPPSYRKIGEARSTLDVAQGATPDEKAAAAAAALNADLQSAGLAGQVTVGATGGVVAVNGVSGSSVGVIRLDAEADGTGQTCSSGPEPVSGGAQGEGTSPMVQVDQRPSVAFLCSGTASGIAPGGGAGFWRLGAAGIEVYVPTMPGDSSWLVVYRVVAAFRQRGVAAEMRLPDGRVWVPLPAPILSEHGDTGLTVGWSRP